ncbi:MAG: Ig-like domain-containing protein [Pseudomonadota bacterium]
MSSHKLIKNAFKLSALSLGLYGFTAQAAIDCSNLEVWQQGQTHVGGDQVQAQGSAYEAKWWTQTNPVETSGVDQEWRLLGVCDSVVNENQAPQISSLTPAEGSLFTTSDSVVINAVAADPDGSVASVEFFVDGTSLSVVTSAPYSASWQATQGSHVISAVATDDLGLTSTAVAHSVSVSDDVEPVNQAPVASIEFSSLPSQVTVGDSVVFALSGTDSDGQVTALSLTENSTEVHQASAASSSYTWQAPALGQFSFTLTVTDNEGATDTQSKVVNVVEATEPGSDCKPQGLYQTPGVNTPYCSVYDTNGREKMGADHPRRVIGYFTSWRNGANGQPSYLVNDIPWDKITHINYAFAHVDGNNKVSIGDPNAAGNPATNMTWPGVTGAKA